jgi:hypothetical protein
MSSRSTARRARADAAGARAQQGVAAGNVFRVESVEPYGWIVYRDGDAQTELFRSRPLALAQACARARANRPSVVLLSNIAGHIERHREYAETPEPARQG